MVDFGLVVLENGSDNQWDMDTQSDDRLQVYRRSTRKI